MTILALRLRFTICAVAAAVACTVAAASPTLASTHADSPAAAKQSTPTGLQAVGDRLVKLGAPGALIMMREGATSTVYVAGRDALSSTHGFDASATWRIASVTKMVTASVIVQLVGEGKLALDDAVATYLPGVVPLAKSITIRQLLNHTSGIPDYLSDPRSAIQISASRLAADLRSQRSFKAAISAALRLPRPFMPGAQHEYSNTNYLLLERIIEKIDGGSFSDAVSRRVLQPLGLRSTGFPSKDGSFPDPKIRGYVAADTPRGPYTSRTRLLDVTEHTFFLGGDGGLYSTATDVLTLLEAFWAAAIVTPSQRARMLANLVEDHDGLYRYGFGITAFATDCGTIVYGHEGRDLGTLTIALTDPARSRHLVAMINRSVDELPKVDHLIAELRTVAFCKP